MDISLYIPCYNAERTISDAIEAAMSQTYPIKEIIVVSDGSTDKTKRIISTYPVKLLTNHRNQGLAYTRNKALKPVETEFVASFDADCLPEKDWLEKLVDTFKRNSLSGVVGAGGRLVEKHSGGIADKWRSVAMEQHWGDKRCVPPYLGGSNTLFQMRALADIDFYDSKYKTNYEDVDICSRLKKRGYIFVYEPDAIVMHRKRDTISTALQSYWRWQFPPKFQQGRYKTLEGVKEQIYYNLSYTLALINRIVLEGGDNELLYPSLLSFFSHSFLDLKKFLEIHSTSLGQKNMILHLKLSYSEILDTTLGWLQKEFYVEDWVMKRVRGDLSHIKSDNPGIVGKLTMPDYKDDMDAKRFIASFYRVVSRYLSSLNKMVFSEMWRTMEKMCLR